MRFCHVSPADQPTEGLHECQCKGRGGKRYEFGKRGWQWLKLSLKNGETVLKVWGVESHSIYLILVEISRLVLQLTLYGQRGYKLSSAEQDKKEKYKWKLHMFLARDRGGQGPGFCHSTVSLSPPGVPILSHLRHPVHPLQGRFQNQISNRYLGGLFFLFLKCFFFLFSQPKNLLLLLNKPFITYCIDCCSANCSLGIVTF